MEKFGKIEIGKSYYLVNPTVGLVMLKYHVTRLHEESKDHVYFDVECKLEEFSILKYRDDDFNYYFFTISTSSYRDNDLKDHVSPIDFDLRNLSNTYLIKATEFFDNCVNKSLRAYSDKIIQDHPEYKKGKIPARIITETNRLFQNVVHYLVSKGEISITVSKVSGGTTILFKSRLFEDVIISDFQKINIVNGISHLYLIDRFDDIMWFFNNRDKSNIFNDYNNFFF